MNRRYIHNDTPSFTTNNHTDEGYEIEIVDAKDYDKLRDELHKALARIKRYESICNYVGVTIN